MSSYKSSLGLIYYFTFSDQNNCLPIYPFGNQFLEFPAGIPLVSLYCLQTTHSPSHLMFVSKTIITCQPLMVRIASFLVDAVAPHSATFADSSVNSLSCTLKEFDLSLPFDAEEILKCSATKTACS
ncbi:hypothetical protein ACQJBY_004938 [Aegilops geniculata]